MEDEIPTLPPPVPDSTAMPRAMAGAVGPNPFDALADPFDNLFGKEKENGKSDAREARGLMTIRTNGP